MHASRPKIYKFKSNKKYWYCKMFLKHCIHLLTILQIETGKWVFDITGKWYCALQESITFMLKEKIWPVSLSSYLSIPTTKIFPVQTGVHLWHQRWHIPQNIMTVPCNLFVLMTKESDASVFLGPEWCVLGTSSWEKSWVVLCQGWASDLKW